MSTTRTLLLLLACRVTELFGRLNCPEFTIGGVALDHLELINTFLIYCTGASWWKYILHLSD